jgi:MATE family multidrug resistance protein
VTLPAAPPRGVVRELVVLALPIIAVNLGMTLMGAVDTLMVGRVSAAALASVALGNVMFFSISMIGIGITLALDPIISQALGADDHVGASLGAQRGVVLAVLVSLPLMALLLLGEPFARVMRQPAELHEGVGVYTTILVPSVLPFLWFSVARQTLQALHRVAPVVWVIILANLANVVLNKWLIFGGLGLAPMGIAGSAWATTLSRYLMLLALLWMARHELLPMLHPVRREAFALAGLGRMLKLGLPIGLQIEIEMATFGAVALLMGSFGTLQVASHQIAINLASLTFMVPMGVGMGAAVLVGRAVGRGDPASAGASAKAALAVGAAFMCFTALMFLVVPRFFAELYTTDAAVIGFVVVLLPLAGIFQVFDGLQVVAVGILRGLGDTRAPMLINLVGFVVLGLGASLYLAYRTSLGPVGLWWGLVIGLAAVAIILLLRVRVALSRPLQRVQH